MRSFIICCVGLISMLAGAAEELQPFRENSLWGFCRPVVVKASQSPLDDFFPSYSPSGEKVVQAQYQWVGYFRDGLARVTREGRFKHPYVGIFDAKWGYIDSTGREITPLQFSSAADFFGGFARVELDGKWGLIDKSGKLVVPAKYEQVRNFYEHRAAVRSKDGWGFCDQHGDEVVPCRYKNVDNFQNAFSRVCRDEKFAWLTLEGNELAFGRYERIMPFDENLAPVKRDSKWGYADTTGEIVITPKWESAGRFAQGLAIVSRGKKQGYIDADGSVVIEPQFLWADWFGKDGMALVKESETSWAFIRRDGAFAFPQRFTRANAFNNGTASVVFEGKWYYLGVTGCLDAIQSTGQFMKMTQAGEEPAGLFDHIEFFSFDFDP